jgi:hypothetical protein
MVHGCFTIIWVHERPLIINVGLTAWAEDSSDWFGCDVLVFHRGIRLRIKSPAVFLN